MLNKKLCPRCKGVGMYMDHGLMDRRCEVCKQTGWVDKEPESVKETILFQDKEFPPDYNPVSLNNISIEVKRGRGRPPKNINA